MNAITFFVPGHPQPAGSKRALPIYRGHAGAKQFTGRSIVVDANPKSKDWKTTVAWEARRAHAGPPREGPVILEVTFLLQRPKWHFGTGKTAWLVKPAMVNATHLQRPDCLKLTRAIEDALTGIVWRDDCQIVTEIIRKTWFPIPFYFVLPMAPLPTTEGCLIMVRDETI